MLPPPPVAAIETHTHLSDLYEYLTTNVLAPDASTVSTNKSYIETHQALRAARQNAFQEQVLLRALTDLTLTDFTPEPSQLSRRSSQASTPEPPSQSLLPPDQQDLVYNISSYLSASLKPSSELHQPLPPDTDELMSDEISAFRTNLNAIATALSTHLISLHTNLSETAATLFPDPNAQPAPQTNTRLRSQRSQPQPQAQQQAQPLSTTLSAHSTQSLENLASLLPTSLSSTLSTLHTAQQTHTNSLTSSIRHLELTTHGSHARYTTARANYLLAVSRGIASKARILRLEREREIYADQGFVDTLESEVETLELEERKLEKRERELVGLLEQYEVAGREVVSRTGGDVEGEEEGRGEEVFKVLGTRYAEVEGEIESVKKDIERLQTQVWRGR